MTLEATFLTDGGQTAPAIAAELAAWLAPAERSLEIAIYDLAMGTEAGAVVRRALHEAQDRGVAVRLVFNQERGRRKLLPPPGFVDYGLLDSLGVEARAIPGVPDLMHHKYVVRDAGTPAACVWTGSTNWTDDSWTREENVVVRLADPAVATAYLANFEELWAQRSVQRTGHQALAWSEGAPGVRVRAYFTPARSEKLVHELAQRIATARRRVRVCSPVLTSGPIMATLAEAVRRPELDVGGCYDRTQMDEVEQQWAQSQASAWKLSVWSTLEAAIPWGAKRSTPYEAGSVHDYMHAKCTVADDTVFVGSYNLSHSGERNAENVLEIENAELADAFATYVDQVSARYRQPSQPELAHG